MPSKQRRNKMNSLKTNLLNYLNNTFLAWLLLPFASIGIGSILGAKANSFQLYPFFLFYFFLLAIGLQEKYLIKKQQGKMINPSLLRHLLGVISVVILLLILVSVNWLAVSLLLLYSLFIYIAHQPLISLEQTAFYYILQLFFKGLILNLLAFYFQAQFISATIVTYLLPVLCFVSILIVLQQRKMLQIDQAPNHFSRFMYLKFKPIIAGLFLVGSMLAVVVLLINKVSIIIVVIFGLFLIATLCPLFLTQIRKQLNKTNYISLVIFIIILIYSFILPVF